MKKTFYKSNRVLSQDKPQLHTSKTKSFIIKDKNIEYHKVLYNDINKSLFTENINEDNKDKKNPQTLSAKKVSNNKKMIKIKTENMLKTKLNKIKRYLLPKKISNKKTLILDLDETLIHSTFTSVNLKGFINNIPQRLDKNAKLDFSIKVDLNNVPNLINIYKRPYVDFFLNKMSDLYELVLFTASAEKYANTVLSHLTSLFVYKFYREHCTINEKGQKFKNLLNMGRSLKDIIIVDNFPLCYKLTPNNGIPIISFFGDPKDKELLKFAQILEFLSNVNDVRDYIPLFVSNNKIDFNKFNEISLKEQKIVDNNINKNLFKSRLNNNNKINKVKIDLEKTLNNNIKTNDISINKIKLSEPLYSQTKSIEIYSNINNIVKNKNIITFNKEQLEESKKALDNYYNKFNKTKLMQIISNEE